MDGLDLMEFNSPEKALMSSPNNDAEPAGRESLTFFKNVDISPGNESLGVLQLKEQALIVPDIISTQITESEPLGISEINSSPCKMSILNSEASENIDSKNSQKESLVFVNNVNIPSGTESLVISNLKVETFISPESINTQNDAEQDGRESLTFFKNVSISPGKESLEVLKLEEQALIAPNITNTQNSGSGPLEVSEINISSYKKSLRILNFGDIDSTNSQKESLVFANNVNISSGTEPLVIPNLKVETFISPESINTQNDAEQDGRKSLTFFKDVNISPGKESLGVLKLEEQALIVPFASPESINTQNDAKHDGRESLTFFKNVDISSGKESLGILKLEEQVVIAPDIKNTQNTGNDSFGVCEINISPYKESLRILNLEASANIDSKNSQKESLVFSNNVNIPSGIESLGIPNLEVETFISPERINTQHDAEHDGRESLTFFKNVDISPGKESLGILKLEEQVFIASDISTQNTESEPLGVNEINVSPCKNPLKILNLEASGNIDSKNNQTELLRIPNLEVGTSISPESFNAQYDIEHATGRESLGFFKNVYISPGKESLGILKLEEQPLIVPDIINTQSESHGICEINISPCKESLRILNSEDIDSKNSQKESLVFLNNVNIPCGTESLGIPNLEVGAFISPESINTLAFLKNVNISPGKESLGILKLEALNSSLIVNNLNAPNLSLSACEEQTLNISDNPLNTAFLYSVNNHKPSVASSNNSYSENPLLFNSGSLDASEPSTILSISSFKTVNDVFSKSEDLLNDAVFLSSDVSKLNVNDLNDKVVTRKRAHSTIVVKENLMKDDTGFRRTCWSVPEFNGERETLNAEADLADVEEKNEDELFNNSVHIEANFIASRLEDGSILEDAFSTECLLDSTGPPDFSILDQCEDDDGITAETDDVNNSQKELDLNINLDNTKESCKSFANNSKNESYYQKLSSMQTSGSNCKSKNANELLHNLSLIINNEDRDPKQIQEAHQLLSGIANILCTDGTQPSNKLENLEDSGHSSIEQEDQPNEQELPVCYKVLDLRTSISKSNDNEKVLDLSMKLTDVQNSTNKRASQSFSFPSSKKSSVKILTGLKAGPSIKSSTSLDSKRDLSDSKEFVKLKPKRIEQKVNVICKGPLKAIMPLGSMAKNKSFANKTQSLNCTPPKIEKNSSSFFKSKRTSTPIAEPSIKPMAQSTPDNKFQSDKDTKPISCSSQLKKRKFYCAVSPLVRPPSIGNMSSDSELNKTTHSGSAPNLSNVSDNSKKNTGRSNSMIPSPKPMSRRHSATELKVTNSNSGNPSKLRRSYSIGKEAKPAVTNRPSTSKQSIVNTFKKQSVLLENNGGTTPKIRSFGLVGKSRKSAGNNKENVAR